VAANCASLLSAGAYVRPVAYLHSSAGTTTPTLTSVTEEYSFFARPVDDVHVCTVWGYVYNESGLPLPGITVRAQLLNIVKYKTKTAVGNLAVVATTNAAGYWEMDLVETENVVPDTKYRFTFSDTGYALIEDKSVPDEPSANYFDLV